MTVNTKLYTACILFLSCSVSKVVMLEGHNGKTASDFIVFFIFCDLCACVRACVISHYSVLFSFLFFLFFPEMSSQSDKI